MSLGSFSGRSPFQPWGLSFPFSFCMFPVMGIWFQSWPCFCHGLCFHWQQLIPDLIAELWSILGMIFRRILEIWKSELQLWVIRLLMALNAAQPLLTIPCSSAHSFPFTVSFLKLSCVFHVFEEDIPSCSLPQTIQRENSLSHPVGKKTF